MSCIVTPEPPAPHAPCMRALAPSFDMNVVTTLSYPQKPTTHDLATAHTMLLTLRNADQYKTFAATGFLDSHAHTNDPESFTDPML